MIIGVSKVRAMDKGEITHYTCDSFSIFKGTILVCGVYYMENDFSMNVYDVSNATLKNSELTIHLND